MISLSRSSQQVDVCLLSLNQQGSQERDARPQLKPQKLLNRIGTQKAELTDALCTHSGKVTDYCCNHHWVASGGS